MSGDESKAASDVTRPSGSEYLAVMRARSSARFLPEEGWEFKLSATFGADVTNVRIRVYTRWAAASQHPLPRELVVEVRGHASSLEEAVAKFAVIANPVANMAGFVANVQVGIPEVHLAYETAAEAGQRAFLETFLPDETGLVAQGRFIRLHLLIPACTALFELKSESARVGRALRQYELALRYWYVGGEWLALSHLYMAVEALTKAVSRKTASDRHITEEELAQSFDIVTDDPSRPRWRQILGERVREFLIFDGDSETFRIAKEASDGLEHGFLELDQIAARALKSADKTFTHVRRTIIDLLGLSPAVSGELMTIKPMDVQSRRKIVRGRLVGVAEDPAAEDQQYPLLEWSSSVGSTLREGSTLHLKETEKITVRTDPDVSFQLDRIEVRGRIENGQAPLELSDEDVLLETAQEEKSRKMLAAVGPMVDAAVVSGSDTGQSFARMLAFHLFGQGTAFFESAYALINDRRVVEALPSLRGLVMIASRFEQITSPNGHGIGIVARMALDSPSELGAAPDDAERYRQELINRVKSSGVEIPEDLVDPKISNIYKSLTAEMKFAQSVVDGTYAAVGLHIKWADDEHVEFHTRTDPSPFTEMISSACVIAQLTLLKHGATVFGWTVSEQQIDGLLAQARALNEESATGGVAT